MENSIDAKSTQIDIEIGESGCKYLKITDNGEGMAFEEIPQAFLRHATSKMVQFEDLYNLYTYGFRGEALASMAAISKVTLVSSNGQSGGRVVIEGGETKAHLVFESKQRGTEILVEDLFYNTPVRLKFLKSLLSEKAALQKIFLSYVLAFPQIAFSLKWDDSPKKIYSPLQTRINRMEEILKIDSKTKGKVIEATYENVQLTGMVNFLESHQKAKIQFLFVNNRPIQDKSLHGTLKKIVESEIQSNLSFDYIFFLELPPDEVDVNVHPSKTIVKFEKPHLVYALFKGAFKKMLIQQVEQGRENKSCFEDSVEKFPSSESSFYFKFSHLALISIKGNLYAVDFKRLILSFFNFLDAEVESMDENLIPLTVSIPLKVNDPERVIKVRNLCEQLFLQYEFQNTGVFLIRAIPKQLMKFPIENFLNETLAGDEPLSSFDYGQLLQLIEDLSIDRCLNNKVMTPLKENFFLTSFEHFL